MYNQENKVSRTRLGKEAKMAEKPRVFRLETGGAQPSQSSPIIRQELMTTEGSRADVAHIAPGVTPWHHHGEYDTYVYAISGGPSGRIEFGPGGKESIELSVGEVVYVPKHIIHRDVTTGSEPVLVFTVRVGTGQPVFNVDGPDPG